MAAEQLGSAGYELGHGHAQHFMCPACYEFPQQIPAGDFQRVQCAFCGEAFSVAFLLLGDFVTFEEGTCGA